MVVQLNPEHGNSPYLPQEVMNKLNDTLTAKFGKPEYFASREEIMKFADPEDEEKQKGASLEMMKFLRQSQHQQLR